MSQFSGMHDEMRNLLLPECRGTNLIFLVQSRTGGDLLAGSFDLTNQSRRRPRARHPK